jgi:hypothetical protein
MACNWRRLRPITNLAPSSEKMAAEWTQHPQNPRKNPRTDFALRNTLDAGMPQGLAPLAAGGWKCRFGDPDIRGINSRLRSLEVHTQTITAPPPGHYR